MKFPLEIDEMRILQETLTEQQLEIDNLKLLLARAADALEISAKPTFYKLAAKLRKAAQ